MKSCAEALAVLLVMAAGRADGSDTETRPGPGPGTYTITPPADSIRIPFDVFRDEIRLFGEMHGREVRMLVDNGALWDELLFFGSPRVDSLGIEAVGQAQVGGAGAGDVVAADHAVGLGLRFEGDDNRVLEFLDQPAIVLPYDPHRPNPWEGSEGQVSSALFKHFVVAFDFDAGWMTLVDPDAFDPAGRGTEVPITPLPESGSWSIPGAITLMDGRRLELDMTMDLGWDEPLGINTGQAHGIPLPDGLAKTLLGIGAQGEIWGYRGTVPHLEVAGHRFDGVPATYSTVEDGGAKAGEVMFGLGVFSRFHVTFDYPRHRLFLRPNAQFGEPFVSPGAR